MRKYLLALALIVTSFFDASASHIVGGELVFKSLKGSGASSHRIGLNLYFDEINGIPQAEDLTVNLYIFRKSDNERIGSVQAPKVGRKNITYANPQCGTSGLRTLFISYAVDVLLNPRDYSDPGGYYIVWDRCCRNRVIDNIRTPGDVGSLFQIFFPPLVKNNNQFLDSSPEFSEIQGDYACLNADYYLDFNANDADGDSLVYSLTTPVTGFSNRAVPNPQALGSSNYPVVSWVDGISLTNMIPGSRPLRVDSQTGRLSFTANKLGLYVFSVTVSEYRNGEKIGSVTRDFQIKVIDCFEALPPKILALENSRKQSLNNNSIIRLARTDSACFTIQVTDPNFNQLIRIKGRAANSQRKDFYILPAEFRTRKSNDTLTFQFCLEDCFETEDNRPIKIELIAEDESCPVPLTDTLTIFIYREKAANSPPVVSTSLTNVYINAVPDQLLSFDVLGLDTDPDSILLSAQGKGFELTKYGFVFPPKAGRGSVLQKFSWKPPCTLNVSDTLAVEFRLTDLRCEANAQTDIITVYFVVQNPVNNPPRVRTTSISDTISVTLDTADPVSVLFDVIANDLDTTQLSLFGLGRGFSLGEMQMDFLDKLGAREISSSFAWIPDCGMLGGKSERLFAIDFISEDKSCLAARDTATVYLLIKDVASDAVLNLPNVLTPNQDGKNDCFLASDLPPDNCIQRFEEMAIYNRWGNRVFLSRDRSQNWCPTEVPSGTYFYQIRYSSASYKGTISLIK
ncbi:gliding motility-associated C-terminal domain-containing protein [Persicitalea sp.]|uniref:T9SS type B sorting domain-containing protein n=1 Tax=Persicitalea sp. TaxID=3100273 RepID=UPI00359433C5